MFPNSRTECETGLRKNDLDHHDQRQDVDRHARWHEYFEELQAVLVQAVEQHDEEYQKRQRDRDDEMGGNGELIRDDPDHVRDQDEHEQGEHQREEPHAFWAGGASGGFMGVGTPERIVDERVRQGKRNLTVIANDTAVPGRGIGKLVEAGLIARAVASHIGLNPETQKQMIAGKMAVDLIPQGTLIERIRAGRRCLAMSRIDDFKARDIELTLQDARLI